MVEANFVERSGASISGDVSADVVLDAIGAHDHGESVPADEALDATLKFLIAGEKRLKAIGNSVGVRSVGRKWEIYAGYGGMGAQALKNLGGDFGSAGFEQRVEGFEPLLHFEVVESVRHRNARAIIGGCAGVYSDLVVPGSCLV